MKTHSIHEIQPVISLTHTLHRTQPVMSFLAFQNVHIVHLVLTWYHSDMTHYKFEIVLCWGLKTRDALELKVMVTFKKHITCETHEYVSFIATTSSYLLRTILEKSQALSGVESCVFPWQWPLGLMQHMLLCVDIVREGIMQQSHRMLCADIFGEGTIQQSHRMLCADIVGEGIMQQSHRMLCADIVGEGIIQRFTQDVLSTICLGVAYLTITQNVLSTICWGEDHATIKQDKSTL